MSGDVLRITLVGTRMTRIIGMLLLAGATAGASFIALLVHGFAENLALAVCATVFLLLAIPGTCYRSGITLDRLAGTMTRWRGMPRPLWIQVRPLDELTAVELSRDTQHRGRTSVTVYPVRLCGAGPVLTLGQLMHYPAARSRAEALAKFLELPLHDSSHGTTVVRDAARLDESLKDRQEADGITTRMPAMPPRSRIHCRQTGSGQAEIDIRAQGLQRSHRRLLFGLVLLAGGIIAALAYDGGTSTTTWNPAQAWPEILIVFALLVPSCLAVLGLARHREVIAVTADSIEVRSRRLFPSSRRLGKAGIEEVFIAVRLGSTAPPDADSRQLESILDWLNQFGAGRCVALRGDHGKLSVGRTLGGPDLRWLHEALRHLVTT